MRAYRSLLNEIVGVDVLTYAILIRSRWATETTTRLTLERDMTVE